MAARIDMIVISKLAATDPPTFSLFSYVGLMWGVLRLDLLHSLSISDEFLFCASLLLNLS